MDVPKEIQYNEDARDGSHEFLLLQIIAGMVVTFSLRELYERSQLIRCAFFIFISYALCYLSLYIYQEADFEKINWIM